MKSDLISIIVPVYNVEKYLEKCLESLINQTYKNIEIIVVNDCSTDSSQFLIEEYCKKDSRIIALKNEKNSGLAFTRNAGMRKVSGKYIGFIDSDDYISLDFYERLYNEIVKNKADLAIADVMITYEDGSEDVLSKSIDGRVTKENLVNSGLAASACNKLLKKELLEYEFEVGKVNEDVAVIIPAIIKAKKICYIEGTYYYYLQRFGSTQNSGISERRLQIFDAVDLTLSRIKDDKNYDVYKDALVFQQLINFLLYVVPKENNFFKRYSILSKIKKRLKLYDYKNNRYFEDFLNEQNKKIKIFYWFLINDFPMISNLGISLFKVYKFFRNNLSRKTLVDSITIDDLVSKAKYNQRQKEVVKLSVIVPNYNYEEFLYQRLYSILNQKAKITELIILDDCSKDNSRAVIDDIVNKLKDYIQLKKVYNSENSGSAFKQWEKGFGLATGDYVWIAEADDYSNKNFLKKVLIPLKKDNKVVISYSDTSFIDKQGNTLLSSIKPEIDIQRTNHWDKDYINEGTDEFNKYTFLNCTIANVSSAIIKKDNYSDIFKYAGTFKQAGDWVFYSSLMHKGKIAYTSRPFNYYRVHGNNVSSITKKEAHFNEILNIHDHYRNDYGLNKNQESEILKRYKFLRKVWKLD